MTQSLPHRPYRFLIAFSGELSLKNKGTRKRFVDRLVSNLAEALRSENMPSDIERSWSRLILHAPSPEAADVARRVFGVKSVTAVELRPWVDLDDLLRQGQDILTPHVEGKTFAVRARRGETSQHQPFSSPEIERRLGALLLSASRGVQLKQPEALVTVEINRQHVLFGGARDMAQGGLPLGTEGKALMLMSGGFDSAVAAWKILRRGVQLEYLFLNLGGDDHRDKVLQVIKVMSDRWSYGYRPRLHMVDFRPHVDELKRQCPAKLWQIVLKRQMLRLADHVARMRGLAAVVTGEVIGQVSSQTLQNLAVISAVTELPILRPLVGEPKEDIIDLARQIGTYEASAAVPEYCALDGKSPETHAKPSRVEKVETHLDLNLLRQTAETRTQLDLRTLDLGLMRSPRREVEDFPDGAEIVDLRSPHAFKSWHYPGARHMDYGEAVQNPTLFEGSTIYVFYCEVGLKSAHLAEVLTRRGLADAFHIAGGLKRVIRLAEGDDDALRALISPVLLEDSF